VNSYFSVFYFAFFTHKYIRLSHVKGNKNSFQIIILSFFLFQFLAIDNTFCYETILGQYHSKQIETFIRIKNCFILKEAVIPYIVSNARLSMLIQMSKKERVRYAERKDLNRELKRILDDWNQSKSKDKNLINQNETHDYTTKAVDATLTDSTLNRRGSTPSFEELSLSQAEIECSQPKWSDLYDDYLEIVVQFGYIIFLSNLFPLAAFFSLLNNLLEIRTDAFKLCMIYQRPFSQRVKDIGQWQV